MKRLLPLVTCLLLGTVSAGALDAISLKNVVFCAADAEAYPDEATTAWLGDLKTAIKTQVDTRMSAYRMTSPTCKTSSKNQAYVFVNITSTDALTNGARGYAVQLRVQDIDGTNFGFITLWDAMTVAVSGGGADATINFINQIVGQQLDKLAADYALANP